jgi:hypothetical protein
MMTQAFLLALAFGEAMGPHGMGSSFVQQKAHDIERQLHHLKEASAKRHPTGSLMQEQEHHHRAHLQHRHMATAHAHGKRQSYSDFQQRAAQINANGAKEVMDGLTELQNMPDPTKGGLPMAQLNAQAAKSQQEMNAIMKQDIAPVKPWVDDTQETIAKSELKVQNTIKTLENDFYGSLAQDKSATSLLEDGNPDSLLQDGQHVMTASERRAIELNKEVQAAAANFDKDFEAGVAEGFKAKMPASIAVNAMGGQENLRAH